MKTYVINLERSTNRRTAMEETLKADGIDFELVGAVDGRTMTDEELDALLKKKGASNKSQAGCMLSHCKVYALMQERDDEYALILEDDILSTDKKIKTLLDDITPQLDADYITLLTYYWCREGQLKLKNIPGRQKMKGAAGWYAICNPSEVHGIARSGAYIISKRLAKRLLDFHTPLIRCHADSWIVYYNHKVISGVHCVYPMLFTENPQFGSEIGYSKNKLAIAVKQLLQKALDMQLPVISAIVKKRRINFANSQKNIVLEH